jgi:deoxyribonuclease-4
MEKVEDNRRLAVCMDTCHMHDAGYDIVDRFDEVLAEFDRIIGLDRLAVVHLNDSKNARGAAKDRHAPVGSGLIGFKAIRNIVHHERLKELPMILETPWIGKDAKNQRPMYEAEIALLRGDAEKRFGSEFFEDVERLDHYFGKHDIHHRDFVVATWERLKNDAKAKKEDKREPMERLYDMVVEGRLFPDYTEEQINHRLTAWFAGKEARI